MDFFGKIFRGDRVIWMIFIFLCLISIVEVYSASSRLTYGVNYWEPIVQHSLGLIAGMFIVLLVHAIPPKYFSIIGVALPLVWGLLIYGWFSGSRSVFGIQPAEFAKLCLIVLSAFIISKRKEGSDDPGFWWILTLTIITCGLIIKGNGSTALMLSGVMYLILFISQTPWKKMLGLTASFVAVGMIFIAFLLITPTDVLNGQFINKYLPRADTWKARIERHSDDSNDLYSPYFTIHTDDEQIYLAQIAISNGGLFGKGLGNSVERDFLPDSVSDFIYAIIIEETGLLFGGLFLLVLYLTLFIRAGIIAYRTDKIFLKMIVLGSAIMIVTQALVHMAVCVRLIPVTGQTLPLISLGRSSIIVVCTYFGMILSVSRYENPKGVQREEDIDAEMIAAAQTTENEINPENEPENE
ncbi:MAG: FtsW/RodA/SpoVE family cell cycle protein [Dysgonamonadaceae bacterium]|jgi:cell division protein FtsW|nr:FtsW/RodA/SpoVE family cell cycle protein [Dysgonamonadaceae bacterium]